MTDSDTLPNIVPVILGGDIATYALGREFHEAYGITSVCVAPNPIGAITHSKLFSCFSIKALSREQILTAVQEISHQNPDKKILLITNLEPVISIIGQIREDFPENVISPTPSYEVVQRISNKDNFAKLCQANGLYTPKSETVHLAGNNPISPTQIDFPVVAKPSYSPIYTKFIMKGFQKVYYIKQQGQLDSLWADLRAAGFSGTFLVQELIGGDDTYMDSITMYINGRGRCTLFAGAQVLLEDHAPAMLGNPVAMITKPLPELWKHAELMLSDIGYRGYANFDIKRDPKTGHSIFLEVNPRIGRNNFYVAAAGENPMRHCVADLLYESDIEPVRVECEVLYTLVPLRLLNSYIRDPSLKKKVRSLIDAGLVFDPQRYDADRGIHRMLDVELTEYNQIRKFARYYPKPTDSSF